MDYKLEIRTMYALHYNDRGNGVHSISAIDIGGPIISDESEANAKEKFELALKLSAAAKNLLYFTGATKSKTEKTKRLFTDNMKEKFGNVEYHEIALK